MPETFGDRLARRIDARSPLCVGLDPSPALLAAWGLADGPAGLEAMGEAVIGAVAPHAAALKPQVAFFERHGSAGLAVLERLLPVARAAGLLVVADAKRGDIDSTMAAYGDAWLAGSSPLAADALTVTAYLGLGAMAAVFERARAEGRGIFCVVASSNPEGRGLQEAVTSSGRSVEAALLAELAAANALDRVAGARLGSFGAVVGATRSAEGLELGSLGGPYLVPGIGTQGAGPDDVGRLFAGVEGSSVLVNASRSLLAAGPSAAALAEAAQALGGELRRALG
jgi:orotidine-5'-phosphate decarboxylase